MREYLAALDEQGEPATVPASISPTDPAARWTAVDGPAFYAYSTNYLIDVQAGIIVDVEATPTLRTAEVNATRTMIERVEERFDLKPERLIKKVEMLFAHLKRIMKLDRLRLRGLTGAHDEFLLAAAAQNLRRMAKWLVPIAEKGEMAPA